MKDKNEFRHLKQDDLTSSVESKPWYIDFYEFVIAEMNSMMELIRVR